MFRYLMDSEYEKFIDLSENRNYDQ